MLRHIHVETTLFSNGEDKTEAERDLIWLLEGLTQRNQNYLLQHPSTPHLYRSGVMWEAPKQFDGGCYEVKVLHQALGSAAARKRDVAKVLQLVQDVFGGEHFCDIGVILELGAIDCDGVACWRAAELRQAGVQARPMMTSRKRPDGGTTYHALVLWPPFGNVDYETTEDPSLLLGMHQPDRKVDRDEEIRKNAERCEIIAKYGVEPVGAGADDILQDVLGLRRRQSAPPVVVDEIERILRRGA